MRILLAVIDHNFHLFQKPKKSRGGDLVGHRKYSKRTQRYHAEVVKEDKAYAYFPSMVPSMVLPWSFHARHTERVSRQFFCQEWCWWIWPQTDRTNPCHEGRTIDRRAVEGTFKIFIETQSQWKHSEVIYFLISQVQFKTFLELKIVNCGDNLLVNLLFCTVLTWDGTCRIFGIFLDDRVRISFCHFGYHYPSHLNFLQIFPCFILVFHCLSLIITTL